MLARAIARHAPLQLGHRRARASENPFLASSRESPSIQVRRAGSSLSGRVARCRFTTVRCSIKSCSCPAWTMGWTTLRTRVVSTFFPLVNYFLARSQDRRCRMIQWTRSTSTSRAGRPGWKVSNSAPNSRWLLRILLAFSSDTVSCRHNIVTYWSSLYSSSLAN